MTWWEQSQSVQKVPEHPQGRTYFDAWSLSLQLYNCINKLTHKGHKNITMGTYTTLCGIVLLQAFTALAQFYYNTNEHVLIISMYMYIMYMYIACKLVYTCIFCRVHINMVNSLPYSCTCVFAHIYIQLSTCTCRCTCRYVHVYA